jgi:S-adenosylmethionine hydrolase
MWEQVSSTFHGRDIFASVAAHLACGTPAADVGEEMTDYLRFSFGEPRFNKLGCSCEIIHIDKFGNIVTNISQRDVD